MNEVIQAAAELQAVCESQGWRFCFIGGVALIRWGEPRETVDADLTLLTGFGGEDPFIETLLQHFQGRIPDVVQFARERRVLLLRSSKGVGLDVALGALPYEAVIVDRSSSFVFPPNVSLRTCSAEDLLVLKAFASRAQDWADIEKIIIRQTGKLEWDYIYEKLRPLAELKGNLEIVDQLQHVRAEFER